MNQLTKTYKNNAAITAGFATLCIVFGGYWLYYISLVTIMLGLLDPRLAVSFAEIWKYLTRKLGNVNATIILSIFYILIIIPVSLLSKLLTKRVKVFDSTWISSISKKEIDFTKPY